MVFKIVVVLLLGALVVSVGSLVFRPAPNAPSAAEIAVAVNGPAEFQRPSVMEYVPKTDSCVVGGTVTTSSVWHVGTDSFAIGEVDQNTVDYTAFEFKSDNGREFIVSYNGALYTNAGENLGLELRCDPATMSSDESFGMIAIVFGGK